MWIAQTLLICSQKYGKINKRINKERVDMAMKQAYNALATSNEQRATSNEQRATSNEQRATSTTYTLNGRVNTASFRVQLNT